MPNLAKWQYLLPMVMLPLFLLALLRAETEWKECEEDLRRVCFYYPLSTPYELRQRIDMHWIAILPAGMVKLHPASLSSRSHRLPAFHWPRIAVTSLSCGAVWYLIGLWAQRFKDGKRLSIQGRAFRFALLVFVLFVVPLLCFSAYLEMRGGYEGPQFANAGFLMPLALAVLGLADLNVFPSGLRQRSIRLGLALMLALLYAWTDNSYQSQLHEFKKLQATKSDSHGFSILLPFQPRSETLDGFGLQAPVLLFAELPGMLFGLSRANPVFRVFRVIIVCAYWFAVFSLLVPGRLVASRVLIGARPWLRGILFAFCLIFIIGWLNARSDGSPCFGFIVGTGIPLFALRPRNGSDVSTARQ